MDISLIISTYGRSDEVDALLDSISRQSHDLQLIEVIVVDQNDQIDLVPVLSKYSTRLPYLVHVKTLEKGLAKSKNKGVTLARGNIVTFPDDDCMFYDDTVSSALTFFKEHPEADVVYGRIFDRKANKNIMREWFVGEKKLNPFNFHLNYSAITCFSKRKDLLFDTHFGVGAFYGSGEELDYIVNALKKNLNVIYTNRIEVWHPELNVNTMTADKIYRYASGYGAVLRKHVNTPLLLLYMSSTVMQILQLGKAILQRDKKAAERRRFAISGRIDGFFKYTKSTQH